MMRVVIRTVSWGKMQIRCIGLVQILIGEKWEKWLLIKSIMVSIVKLLNSSWHYFDGWRWCFQNYFWPNNDMMYWIVHLQKLPLKELKKSIMIVKRLILPVPYIETESLVVIIYNCAWCMILWKARQILHNACGNLNSLVNRSVINIKKCF